MRHKYKQNNNNNRAAGQSTGAASEGDGVSSATIAYSTFVPDVQRHPVVPIATGNGAVLSGFLVQVPAAAKYAKKYGKKKQTEVSSPSPPAAPETGLPSKL